MKPIRISKAAQKARQQRQTIIAKYMHLRLRYLDLAQRIQDELGLPKRPSYQLIKEDERQMLEEWKNERTDMIDLYVEMELSDVRHTVEQLWDEWERSKTHKTVQSKKKKGHIVLGKTPEDASETVPESEETSVRQEGRLGDPRYIQLIADQQKERRKILGIYAPEETTVRNIDVPLTKEDMELFKEAFQERYMKRSE